MDYRRRLSIIVEWFVIPVYVVSFMVFTWVGSLIFTLALIPAVFILIKSVIFGREFKWSNIKSYKNKKINNMFAWWFSKQHEIMSKILSEKPIDQLRKFEKNKSRSLIKMSSNNIVYCYRGEYFDRAFGYFMFALSSDGKVLAVSSAHNIEQGKENLGFFGNNNHYRYKKHFPKGYSMEWVDDAENHDKFLTALKLYEYDIDNNKFNVKYHIGLNREELANSLQSYEVVNE